MSGDELLVEGDRLTDFAPQSRPIRAAFKA
jgi:hypothetical protein